MTIEAAHCKFLHSVNRTATGTNGGDADFGAEIADRVLHNSFARVRAADLESGANFYRKEHFWAGSPAADEILDFLYCHAHPSNADDRFVYAAGTFRDDQDDIVATPPTWKGVGRLDAGVSAGGTSLTVTCEGPEATFEVGDHIYIHDMMKTGQTAAADVAVGDSVEYNGGTGAWDKIVATADIAYPKGLWLGNGEVRTDDGANEEYAELSAASQTGSTWTLTLSTGLQNSYTDGPTLVAGCVYVASRTAEATAPSVSSTAGTFSGSVAVVNDGAVEDDCVVTFTSGSAFSVTSARDASTIGSGTVGTDFAPLNADTGKPLFTIPSAGWGGTWALGDTMTFSTHPATVPIWNREIIDAATAALNINAFVIRWRIG